MCILAVASALNAQTDDQYRMEIGAGVGLMSYQGDFNGSIMKTSSRWLRWCCEGYGARTWD